MSSLFSGINVALQSLLAHQQAIQVTEHNVANANTPGYHRQEAILAAGVPYALAGMEHSYGAGQMGTGVKVEMINRFSVDFFDTRYRRELTESSRWSTQSSVMKQIEAALNETGSDGIIAKLDQFWSGWQALSGDPTNLSLRADLLERSKSLTEAFHWRAGSLTNLQRDQDLAINQRVGEINTIAHNIAGLNQEIARIKGMGDEPNDLRDVRDQMLDRLSQITGAVSHQQVNDEVIVSVGGHALVIGAKTFQVNAVPDSLNGNLLNLTWSDGEAFKASTGELAGLLEARDKVIPGQLAGLNLLASTLADQVNTVHMGGRDLNNIAGLAFFTGSTAADLNINGLLVDGSMIAAAQAANAPGDGSVALNIGRLRDQSFIGGATLNNAYNRQVTDLGLNTMKATNSARDRGTVATALAQQRESVVGVSLDEEAANLVKYQKAYSAAARLMTAFDQMIDTVMNMGVVGR